MVPNRSPHPAIARAGQSLRDLLLRRDLSSFAIGPQQGSPFEFENQRLPLSVRAGAGTILAHAAMVCQFRLMAAMDFISGIASLASTATSVYSVFPLSRSVIECVAYVNWILEPDVTAEERAFRGALDHYKSTCESMDNLRRYNRSGVTEDESRAITRDIVGFESKLSDIEQDLSLARDLLPSNADQKYPHKRQVVDRAVAAFSREHVGATHYGYLSDIAHGGVAGLMELHQGEGMMENFNISVDRFLLPVAIAVRTMQPCLSQLADSWGMRSPDGDMQRVFEVLEAGFRDHDGEPAFI